MLDQRGVFGRRILDLDYDIYAEGEAELGWLNSSLHVTAPKAFPLDDLLLAIVRRLRKALQAERAETAHLKTIGLWEGFYGVANLIANDRSRSCRCPRTAARPKPISWSMPAWPSIPSVLEEHVQRAVNEACQAAGAKAEFRQTQSFRPGRPVPTHRFEEALVTLGGSPS